jgi:CubicO group peptidase (beta-lactamase class C family)
MAARSLDEARLATVIAEVLHRHPAGGLAVGVVGRGGPEFFRGFGVADTALGTPITQDTVFRIGSISKTFTAIAVMQLRERGLVDLDDPVSQHLRSYRLAPARRSFRPATIAHLLTHTGGIGEVRGLTDLFRPTIGLATERDHPAPSLAAYYRGGLRAAEQACPGQARPSGGDRRGSWGPRPHPRAGPRPAPRRPRRGRPSPR